MSIKGLALKILKKALNYAKNGKMTNKKTKTKHKQTNKIANKQKQNKQTKNNPDCTDMVRWMDSISVMNECI